MTKTISGLLALAIFAGLAGSATGCKSLCRKKNSSGILNIVRQPVDTEVQLTNGVPQTATFRLRVKDAQSARFAWYKIVPNTNGYREELLTKREGDRTNVLTIENVSTNDRGLYFAEIANETTDGRGEILTRSRLAELKVFDSISIRMAPQVSSGQLQGCVPGTNPCGPGGFAASITFAKDDSGQKFVAAGSTCQLSVKQVVNSTSIPLTTNQFGARWIALTPKQVSSDCAGDGPDSNTRSFAVKYAGTPYTFVVYLKNPAPVGTTFQLTVDWKP